METAVTDTGAQKDMCGATLALRLGINISSLFPVKAKMFGASRAPTLTSLVVSWSSCQRPKGSKLPSWSCVVHRACHAPASPLNSPGPGSGGWVFSKNQEKGYRRSGRQQHGAKRLAHAMHQLWGVGADGQAVLLTRSYTTAHLTALAAVSSYGGQPAELTQYILDQYASSTFNMCVHQPLPTLKSSPSLKLHMDPAIIPKAVRTPMTVLCTAL